MRQVALVSVFICACGAIAVNPRSDEADASADSGAGQAPTPVTPEPRRDCRPASDAIESAFPVSIPPGVTADFAVEGARPVIATTPSGDAIVAWHSGNDVRIRLYRDARWFDVETITAPATPSDRFAQTPKVAMRPDGSIVVAYHESASSSHDVVCTRERDSNGTWSAVSTLALTGIVGWQDPSPPVFKLAVDEAGNITALVAEPDLLDRGLLAFRAPPGGRFGAPARLVTTELLWDFTLAMSASGDALALWPGPGFGSLTAAVFSPVAGWGPNESVGLGHVILGAAPERDGSMSVLGAEFFEDGGARLHMAKRASDGGWTALSELADFPGSYARIASDDVGRAMVAGSSWSSECTFKSGVVRRDASGKWGGVESIPGAPPGKTTIGEIALSHSGHGLVAWEDRKSSSGVGCVSDGAYLSWLSPEGAWLPPMLLDSKGDSEATLALTPSGRALVAWSHGDRVLVRWLDPP